MGTAAEKREWVARVLKVEVPNLDDGSGADAAQAPPDLATLAYRLNTARDRARALPDPAVFAADLASAGSAIDREDAVAAAAAIDTLEARLRSAERAKAAADEIADAKSRLGIGAVAFGKLRLQLRALEMGRGIAISQIQAAGAHVLDNDFEGDPRQAAGRAALAGIAQRVPGPSPALIAAIDDLGDTDNAAKQAAARATALSEIRRYRASVDAEPILRELEKTPYGTYKIHGQIAESLAALETALNA